MVFSITGYRMPFSDESLSSALTSAASSLEIRLLMAERGWRSETRLMDGNTDSGAFQIWFKRADWHGRSAEVTVHTGTSVTAAMDDDGRIQKAMGEAVLRAALRAAAAWRDFTDCVPCQGLDGVMVRSDWDTQHAFSAGAYLDPRFRPTELFPVSPRDLCAGGDAGDDRVLGAALQFSRLGALYADQMNPWTWTPGSHHLDRKWGFEHRIAFPRWNGVRTDFRPVTTSTSTLAYDWVAAQLQGSLATFRSLLEVYGPGKPAGPLPPFFRPSPLPVFKAEEALRRQEVLADPRIAALDPLALGEMVQRWEARRRGNPVLSERWCAVTGEHVEIVLENLRDEEIISASPAP